MDNELIGLPCCCVCVCVCVCGESPEHLHIYAGEEIVGCPTPECRAVWGWGNTLHAAIAAYMESVAHYTD